MMLALVVIVSVALFVFALRRYLFLLASLLPRRPLPPVPNEPIAVLVAARNEEFYLPRLLDALGRLDYPAHHLRFVLVSDGSTDATPAIMTAWADDRADTVIACLPESGGKAGALRHALTLAPDAPLIAIFDADTVPAPDALLRLAAAFADPSVGAAGGYPEPANANASISSRYAAIERWILHLVTLRGKDALHMNPAAIGAICMIRSQALLEIGGFPAGVTAEDVHISLRLNHAGWRTRSILDAVAREDVPETFHEFNAQRLRWSRGLMEARSAASGAEDLFVAVGYLDRVVLLAAAALAWYGLLPLWLIGLYLSAPVVTILLAVARANATGKWLTLAALPAMILADVAVTVYSLAAQLIARPIPWALRAGAKAARR